MKDAILLNNLDQIKELRIRLRDSALKITFIQYEDVHEEDSVFVGVCDAPIPGG